jgi:hypothetical protein
MNEIDVLLEQLDELLHEPILTGEDALEVAVVAGLAARLGATDSALQDSVLWREGEGKELLDEGLSAVNWKALADEVDGLLSDDDRVVEDTLSDFDDAVAASLWCGQKEGLREAATAVSGSIRQVPETFSGLAQMGVAISALPAVSQEKEIYDYWRAVADCAKWAES